MLGYVPGTKKQWSDFSTMTTEYENKRQSERVEDIESGLGFAIWQPENNGSVKNGEQNCRFVGICNRSKGGMMVESPKPLDTKKPFVVKRYKPNGKRWQLYEGEVVWSRPMGDNVCHIGIRVSRDTTLPQKCQETSSYHNRVIDNLEFFLELPLLQYLPRKTFWALLNCVVPRDVKKDERFINQGDEAKSLFIIEKGRGQVSVEKDGEELEMIHLGPQDLVGEMAILTGELRMANFTANEDMLLWELDRLQFQQAMDRLPEMRTFLTELVSRRLESSVHSADRIVGKYIAKHKIGSGAWAIVYQGVHRALNKTVAIKMLKHQMAMDEEFSTKFIKEARVIANMNHPNIVHVYDIESMYATRFIVMEYLEGESLEQRLKRTGLLPPAKAVQFLLQICAGLEYAHSFGIIHQDIKPDNILVQKDETIKILDFGLACPSGSENFVMEGTIQYMSPEQIDSYPVDARTDIYCLGITAFEMVTGKRPYPDEDLQEMMVKRLDEDIPNPAEFQDKLPDRLCEFILKSCARQPGDRYQSVKEATKVLHQLAQEMGLHQPAAARQHMSSLFLFYTEEQRTILGELLEEFSLRASESGVRMQLADFENVTSG